MISYRTAITKATELCNMPNAEINPAKFIVWAEDIAYIYDLDYDAVAADIQEVLGFLDE